jgi:RNA polymerase sigma factor (sigma-70 family)
MPLGEPEHKLMTLLDEVRGGSEAAAWTIIELYGSHVLRAVRRSMHYRLRNEFDSNDFVQLVWISFFRRPDELGHLHSPRQLVAWLVSIARNKVIDEVRRRLKSKRRDVTRNVYLDLDPAIGRRLPAKDATPSAVAIAKERWEMLIDQQPTRVQRMLELRLGGAKYCEIADELNVHERTVRKAIDRILKRCKSWAAENSRPSELRHADN